MCYGNLSTLTGQCVEVSGRRQMFAAPKSPWPWLIGKGCLDPVLTELHSQTKQELIKWKRRCNHESHKKARENEVLRKRPLFCHQNFMSEVTSTEAGDRAKDRSWRAVYFCFCFVLSETGFYKLQEPWLLRKQESTFNGGCLEPALLWDKMGTRKASQKVITIERRGQTANSLADTISRTSWLLSWIGKGTDKKSRTCVFS